MEIVILMAGSSTNGCTGSAFIFEDRTSEFKLHNYSRSEVGNKLDSSLFAHIPKVLSRVPQNYILITKEWISS
jgi:hypothetical protein